MIKVIGTIEKQGSSFGRSQDNRVLLPITTLFPLEKDGRQNHFFSSLKVIQLMVVELVTIRAILHR